MLVLILVILSFSFFRAFLSDVLSSPACLMVLSYITRIVHHNLQHSLFCMYSSQVSSRTMYTFRDLSVTALKISALGIASDGYMRISSTL